MATAKTEKLIKRLSVTTVLERFIAGVRGYRKSALVVNTEDAYYKEIRYRLNRLEWFIKRFGNYAIAKIKPEDTEKNPYKEDGPRSLALAWEEGYIAGRMDDPCPNPKKHNKGRHCGHWLEGDSACCNCGKMIEGDQER